MKKPLIFGLLLAALVGGAYFLLNYEVQSNYENGKLAYVKIVARRGPANVTPVATTGQPSAGSLQPTFRLATFHLGRYDESKQANLRVSDVLERLLPQFDLIAVQGIRGKNQGVLVRLVERLSAVSGRAFDFATCPTQQRDAVEHYNAFLFDRAKIEIDRTTVHFVQDRQNSFRAKPLVGAFRARGPSPSEAFTFTLINVEVDPDRVDAQLDILADVYRAVRDDGRNEDDVILLGDLERDDAHLGRLGNLLGVSPLLSNVPTTVRGTQLLDNILLDRRATCEFNGRAEVVDVLREYELTMASAAEVSEHLPIWAEFSIYEFGQPGHVFASVPK